MHTQTIAQNPIYIKSSTSHQSFKNETKFKLNHHNNKKFKKLSIIQANQSEANETTSTIAQEAKSKTKDELYKTLNNICEEVKRAPPSEKSLYSTKIFSIFKKLKENEIINKWGIEIKDTLKRRNISAVELKLVGIKNPEKIAQPSTRNDLAFLVTVVGTTSLLAVATETLPGDWGFFLPYLIGGSSLVVLAIGSTSPGLLQFFIDKFSRIFPDYRDRTRKHEAGHFLIGYLLGVPISSYSLNIGKEHTDFAEAKLQRSIFKQMLDDDELDILAVIAMAGVTAEALAFDDVIGQTADLFDLQKLMRRSKAKLSNVQEQNVTRWAAYQAAILLRSYKKEFESLQNAMENGASVTECVKEIES